MATVQSLNIKLLVHIFCQLSIVDFFSALSTCKLFYSLSSIKSLWIKLCSKRFEAIMAKTGCNFGIADTSFVIDHPHWPRKYQTININHLFDTIIFPTEHGWMDKPYVYIAKCLCNNNSSSIEHELGYRAFSNSIVIGRWFDGSIEGPGIHIYHPSTLYVGGFKDGKKHGHGYYLNNDVMYVGWFDDGHRHDVGQYIDKNKDYYEGQWACHKMNGFGKYYRSNENNYIGYFKDNLLDGKGIISSADGTKYIGEFVENKRHGYGTIIHPDGYTWSGNMVNNMPVDSSLCVHPDIVATLAAGKCTSTLTGAKLYYSQFLYQYRIDNANIYLCEHCHSHHINNDVVLTDTIMTAGLIVCTCACEK